MDLDKIGIWSEIKLTIVRKYAAAFTRILKTRSWCRGCFYIDAFAGAGIHVSRSTGEMVAGSPLNALSVEPPFDRIVLIDVDSEKVDSLQRLCGGDKRVEIHEGDCNDVLLSKVAPRLGFPTYRRALCVLDPYGIHGKTLRWPTIKAMADLQTTDLFLNFPLMDINRNVLRQRLDQSAPSDIVTFSDFWGGEDWKPLMYQDNLFGEPDKIGDNLTLAKGFRNRLLDVAGFEFVPEPILMRNTKGGGLYYLFFASHQPVAQKIIEDIFREYGRA